MKFLDGCLLEKFHAKSCSKRGFFRIISFLKSYKGSSLLLEGTVTSYEVVKVSSCHISRRDLD